MQLFLRIIVIPMSNASTSPVIAEGLQKHFGDVVAVDGIDLEVQQGEIFGFLGPNGAGKSTTVRILTTLLRPTGGSARVAGFDVVGQADQVRRSIGVALQDAAIDPLMTGRELLKLQAVLHGIGRKEGAGRSERLLNTVGLVGAADRRVGTYSGGMRRRLDMALSLMHEPVVLFLDEPTTGLDPNSRQAIWDEVRMLNQDFGTTVFLTTQYMEEADQLAGRIAIIDLGKIVADGTPAALKKQAGDPVLRVAVTSPTKRKAAEKILDKFGERATGSDEYIAVKLKGGAGRIAAVARALETAKVKVDGIELHSPTLDDVFQIVTGRRLEGEAAAPAEDDQTKPPRGRRRRSS
ncbi:MAG TPA: ATP-binding cassette domain-containing protein [Actinomycetota bacterium]|nr:ATP-binding cassette domain-containing protein [Actinomycetota bacterium]